VSPEDLRKTGSVKAAFGTAKRRQALTGPVFRETPQSQRIDGYPSTHRRIQRRFRDRLKTILDCGNALDVQSFFKLVAHFWIVR
jgi:hypothetical protein